MKEYEESMNEKKEKKKKLDNQRVIVMKNNHKMYDQKKKKKDEDLMKMNQNLLNMKVKRIRRDVKDDICDEKEKSEY